MAPPTGAPGTAPSNQDEKVEPAMTVNRCGAAVAEVEPDDHGLTISVDFPEPAAGVTSIDGTATLTNTSRRRVEGITGISPVVTLSRAGIVVWTTNAQDLPAQTVDLDPGESMTYPAWLDAVDCESAAASDRDFTTTTPPLGPGAYQVSALIDFSPATSADSYVFEVVSGPSSTLVLK